MQELRDSELDRAYRSFNRVFAQTQRNPRRALTPFRDRMEFRAIVIVGPFHFAIDDELPALIQAMRTVDEDSFYVTTVDRMERDSWLVAPDLMKDYGRGEVLPPGVIASALYSTRGSWGIWIDEFTGLLGSSSREFVETFLSQLPPALVGFEEEDVEIAAEDMAAGFVRLARFMRAREGWVIPMLEHMYGGKRARELLLEGAWYDGPQV